MRRAPLRKPNVYHFKRKVFLPDAVIVASSTGLFGLAYQFRLIDLPNVTDFTNLYDMYRFNKVVMKLIPKYSDNLLIAGGNISNSNIQQVHSVIDYDDLVSPTSISQLCEYQSHKMTRGNQVHTRVIVPKCQLNVGNIGAAAPVAKQWIDCDQTSISHRGAKVVIPAPLTADTQISYDLELTYYVSFKCVV